MVETSSVDTEHQHSAIFSKMRFIRRPSIKKLSLRRRWLGLTSMMRMTSKKLQRMILKLVKIFKRMRYRINRRKVRKLKGGILALLVKWHHINSPPRNLELRLPRILKRRRTIDSFRDDEIPIFFRFRTKEQLHRLMRGFRIPEIIRIPVTGNIYYSEEFLLVSLYRLYRPTALSDGCFRMIFGLGYTAVSMVFNAFLDFMIDHWGYLLLDSMNFWKPFLPDCAQAIRDKCVEKGCYFPDSRSPHGLRVAGFIDNTMNATCRPGGGPARDGINAPRNDPLIQRAWYNGWKKLHGE
jgi:hypothetical protein